MKPFLRWTLVLLTVNGFAFALVAAEQRTTLTLAITEAGPGFAAEAQAVTTTTLYYFPGGEKQLKQTGTFNGQPTGAVVYAKLFAPKGRTLQSVSGVRVLKATDDLGREIVSAQADGGMENTSASAGSLQGNSAPIQLRLPLPLPDAQSIDELSGEAIAVTAGRWREIILTNINESFTNEVDLAGVLPGAKLVLAKFKTLNRQISVQAQINGPAAIRQIEIQTRSSSGRRGNASITENSFTPREDQAMRSLQIQSYDPNVEDGTSGSLSLVVRYPEDQRRERVRFTLKGLDLL